MGTEQLTRSWLELWNGDYDQAGDLVVDDFRVHAALMGGDDGGSVSGRAGLVGWIGQIRAVFSELAFSVQVGPIAQDDHLAIRWIADGTYGGGYPGAAAPVGALVSFTGTDLLRISEGRLAEYWVNSDMHVLFAQLRVSA